MKLKLLTAALAVAALIPATAHAQAAPVTAALNDGKLTITRAGAVAFDAAIPDAVCDGCIDPEARVVDLDGDGEGEVVVTSFTGGNGCCTLLGVYDYRAATGTYGELGQNMWALGFTLDDLEGEGVPEFNAYDLRFNARFTSRAGSFPPPAVYRYERPGGVPRLTDVTRSFPAVIRANAAEAKKRFSARRPGEAEGFVAAYVADQYLLGSGSKGLKELDKQIRRGILGRPKIAKAFRTRLLKLLDRYGYR